jgi:hypothetical protein
MNRLPLRSFAVLCLLAASGAARAQAVVYTDLHGKGCKTLSLNKETGASTRRCPGAAGFSLLVHDEDGRASIDIVAPGKRAFQLNFWDVVTSGYSQVGRKAEWHLATVKGKLVPVGLVVRVDTVEQTDWDRIRRKSLATVTQIRADGACVVFKIDGASKQASARTHKAAGGGRRACLGTVES